MEKNCAYCNKLFTTDRPNRIYCTDSHRAMATRGNSKKQLNGELFPVAEQPQPQPQTQPQKQTQMKDLFNAQKLPNQLDPVSSFIVKQLERERDKLEEKIKKLESKNESLITEKDKLKEDLIDLQDQIKAKPTGLAGFASSNPDMIKTAMEVGLPKALELIERFMSKPAPQLQLGGGEAGTQSTNHPVWAWLTKQPEDIQRSFVLLIEGLEKSGDIAKKLNYFNTTFMQRVTRTMS